MKRLLLTISIFIYLFCTKALAQSNQTVTAGASTTTVTFPGPGCMYNWVNDTPGIGLPANGTGDINAFTAMNSGGSAVTATITATPAPSGFAYITNYSSNNVTVINIANNSVVATVPVGSGPWGVAISPDGAYAYITNNVSNDVSVINTATNKVVATITVALNPIGAVVSPDGTRLYVTNLNGHSISVINTATNKVLSNISIVAPIGIVVSPDGSKLYVVGAVSNNVSVISSATNNITTTIPVGSGPNGISISPDGSRLYVANNVSDDVSVINTSTNTLVATVKVGGNALCTTVSPDGSRVYVTSSSSNISVINTATNLVVSNIPAGPGFYGISFSSDGSQLYAADGSGVVADINAATYATTATIGAGSQPTSLGNFITKGTCSSPPVKFTITVNPAAAASPVITPSAATGTISSCVGTASASPFLQQVTVSGTGLPGDILASVPSVFEVSLSPTGGFGNFVTLKATGGVVNSTVIYIRSAATASAGIKSGYVDLTSGGLAGPSVPITETINALATVNPVGNQIVNNGASTTAVNFTGTGNTFTWTNDKPGIGLAATGFGDIKSFTAINTGTTPVTATVTVTPTFSGYAFIPSYDDASVAVINTTTNAVVKTIPVGQQPIGVSASTNGNVYITNTIDNTVSVINATTLSVTATIPVGNYPWCIMASPDGSRLYVSDTRANSISVISTGSNSVISTITLSDIPGALCVSPDGSRLYVTNYNNSSVWVINTTNNTVMPSISVGAGPNGLAFSPDGSKLYVANAGVGTVSVVNTSTGLVTATITVGSDPYAVVVSPDGSRVYVTNDLSGSVSVINAANNTVVATVMVGSPIGISIKEDGSRVYVVNGTGYSVAVIDATTNSVVSTVGVGRVPYAIGNFVAPGTGCGGTPTQFTITVNPDPVGVPTIITGAVTGTISACKGTASASPDIQQFTVSGSSLTNNISLVAPNNFEISLSPGNGFTGSLTLIPKGGLVSSTIIYVRSAASATGGISGNVSITSAGASPNKAPVTGTINPLPTVNAVAPQTVNSGTLTNPINFTGTGTVFNWVNDTPGIGLAASGTGNMPSFTAVNNTGSNITATVTVTPQSPGTGCAGTPVQLLITVKPTAKVASIIPGNTTGTISACLGFASVSPYIQQFTVNASNLTGGITAVPSVGFEASLNPNSGYGTSINIPETARSVTGVTVYVRAAATKTSGNLTGSVTLTSGATRANASVSGVVNSLATMNVPSPQVYADGQVTSGVVFNANGNNVSWTNDSPGIGLAASGTGNIPPFTAINKSGSKIVAKITATPLTPGAGCPGTPVSFNITVNSSVVTPSLVAGNTSGTISACVGTPSASPNIKQFTCTGSNLNGDVTVTCSVGFEISLTPSAGYGNTLTITPSGGAVNGVIIYVRAAATTTSGNITGSVLLNSNGAAEANAGVSGLIYGLPTINTLTNLSYASGALTSAVDFSGTGTTYSWTNDNPAIGLQANGTGNIDPFTATNNGSASIVANITVTTVSATGCTGPPAYFTITVAPAVPPSINTTGALSPLNTIYGTPSTSTVFSVSATGLTAGILIAPPAGFEISTDDISFSNSVTIGSGSTVTGKQVYIRLAAITHVGNYSGQVTLNSAGFSTIDVPMPQSTVIPAPLTITADDKIKTFGTANPQLTASYAGFVNGDTPADLVSEPVLATTAVISSPIGQYPITLSGYASNDYSIIAVSGVLNVIGAIQIPNTFTPNGDGINDAWNIKYLGYYSNCTVQIFTRYGQNVFSSVGYGTPWDGTFKGARLPPGTYYYVIDLKNNSKNLSGFIALLR